MMTEITTNKLRLMEHLQQHTNSTDVDPLLANAIRSVQEYRIALLSGISDTLESYAPVDQVAEEVSILSKKLCLTTNILTDLRALTTTEVFNQAMGVSNTDD